MKTLIQNALVYNGTGEAPFTADVLLEGDKILKVEQGIATPDAQVVDASGLSLAPGFIDAHSHNDWFAIKQDALPGFAPFIRQGITSFVTGNCGIAAAGYEADTPHLEKIGADLFSFHGATGRYPSHQSFFAAVDGKMPCNIAALAGHCTARASVAGYQSGALSPEDSRAMLSLLEESLQQGACGVSLGLMYEPGLYAPMEELKAVARLCAQYDRPLTVHPRACSKVSLAYPQLLGRPHILRAMDELREVTRGLKVKLQYSHAIFVGRSTFGCKDELMSMLERMRQDGVDAGFDIYNETLGTSVITVIMPAWYQAMTPEQRRKPFNKLRFTAMVRATIPLLGFSFDDILIAWAGEGNERFENKTVSQIARELNMSQVDAYLHLCEISHFKGRVNMGPYSTRSIISELSRDDHVLFMTDAWVEEKGVQNPALYDCFPKFLQDALTGRGDTLPRTIRKMTGATADRFSLKNRGYVLPGYHADLTLFDEKAILSGVPDVEKPFGIQRVYINGHLALAGDKLLEENLQHSGQAMRV